ncbi:MAG: hypothetical protein HXY35_10035 [Chloroflexi bacterium]|nr:hypothetical protein [Chloroflexota bacterium]
MKGRKLWIGVGVLLLAAALLGYLGLRYYLGHREKIVIENSVPGYELQFGAGKARLEELAEEWGVWREGIKQPKEGRGVEKQGWNEPVDPEQARPSRSDVK